MNLAGEEAAVPLGVPHARVLAAWDAVEAPGADGVLRLPAESCAVLGLD